MSKYKNDWIRAHNHVHRMPEKTWIVNFWDSDGVARTGTIQPEDRANVVLAALDARPELERKFAEALSERDNEEQKRREALAMEFYKYQRANAPRTPRPAPMTEDEKIVAKWDALVEKHSKEQTDE